MVFNKNKKAAVLLLVSFDQVLGKHCKEELSPFCELDTVSSMDGLEQYSSLPSAIIYLMDYTSATHLHNVEYIRNQYSNSLLFVVTTAVSIPLLHQSLHLGVDDLFLFPFSEQDKHSLVCTLKNKTEINCFTEKLESQQNLPCAEVSRENPISSLLNIIERDFAKGPSLQDLSHDIHLSPSRLCHMFKDLCGLTYSHYLLCRKLEESERLLTDSESSVTTISYQMGFSNPSHFCRSFKEHFNITPNSYAQGNRELKQSPTYIRYQRLRSELIPNMGSVMQGNFNTLEGRESVG
ncbi:AraC family transcriptional regulator [Thalassotalea psychrophila]|uniref:AraC family transcriptional regulator n=1 Tax=Thalassotalea psychrophila TaxID=3065647 RepID=A0ABY9TWY0_9GAMM|nr:AraC family transcriptional regulator [Colwelliaceae bacterium SQ149]